MVLHGGFTRRTCYNQNEAAKILTLVVLLLSIMISTILLQKAFSNSVSAHKPNRVDKTSYSAFTRSLHRLLSTTFVHCTGLQLWYQYWIPYALPRGLPLTRVPIFAPLMDDPRRFPWQMWRVRWLGTLSRKQCFVYVFTNSTIGALVPARANLW